jgi:hypothetical protein
MTPFQCDLCHFRNIQGGDPSEESVGHGALLAAIRRANLDAFWARRPNTVGSNLYEVRRMVKTAVEMEVLYPVGPRFLRGPCPLRDNWGMFVAVATLDRTLDEGKTSLTVQYATARRLHLGASNLAFTTTAGSGPITVMSDRYRQRFTGGPTASLFFERFAIGCHERMGDVVVRNQALRIELLERLLMLLEADYVAERATECARFEASLLGSALTLGFSMALRGEELGFCLLGPTVEETTLSLSNHPLRYLTVVMEGRFKGVRGRKQHRFTLATTGATKALANQNGWEEWCGLEGRVARGH